VPSPTIGVAFRCKIATHNLFYGTQHVTIKTIAFVNDCHHGYVPYASDKCARMSPTSIGTKGLKGNMPDHTSLPPSADTTAALKTTSTIVHEYLAGIGFIIGDAARDPGFGTTHLLSYLSQDFIESAVAISFLAREGSLSVPKRELRFIIESSIKICYVQQKNYSSSIEDKLTQFDKVLSSANIW
jgi:hypothetical protein